MTRPNTSKRSGTVVRRGRTQVVGTGRQSRRSIVYTARGEDSERFAKDLAASSGISIGVRDSFGDGCWTAGCFTESARETVGSQRQGLPSRSIRLSIAIQRQADDHFTDRGQDTQQGQQACIVSRRQRRVTSRTERMERCGGTTK
jgi:hypothetical protein